VVTGLGERAGDEELVPAVKVGVGRGDFAGVLSELDLLGTEAVAIEFCVVVLLVAIEFWFGFGLDDDDGGVSLVFLVESLRDGGGVRFLPFVL